MTEEHQPKDTRFKPGQSGNAKGRPAGSRSKVLVALDALGEGEAEDIVKAQIEKAKGGDCWRACSPLTCTGGVASPGSSQMVL